MTNAAVLCACGKPAVEIIEWNDMMPDYLNDNGLVDAFCAECWAAEQAAVAQYCEDFARDPEQGCPPPLAAAP